SDSRRSTEPIRASAAKRSALHRRRRSLSRAADTRLPTRVGARRRRPWRRSRLRRVAILARSWLAEREQGLAIRRCRQRGPYAIDLALDRFRSYAALHHAVLPTVGYNGARATEIKAH